MVAAAVEITDCEMRSELPNLQYLRREGPQDLFIADTLAAEQPKGVRHLADDYAEIFSDLPERLQK